MSAAVEHTIPRSTTRNRGESSFDWEAPAGPVQVGARPRVTPPAFLYHGYGDPHWRGQTCHLVGSTEAEHRTVILACGCRVSVPWWTLEPLP
jgi:hypothetical protein